MNNVHSGYFAVGLLAAVIAGMVHLHASRSTALLKIEYLKTSAIEAADAAKDVGQAFQLIYQNLRTLASLPGIRSLDRHAETLTPEARTTFQMIYNNLASSVSVSEVYVVPANFNPQRLDPATGKTEEPIIMFDQLILNAGSGISSDQRASDPASVTNAAKTGPEEIEAYEYAQLAEQAAWFRGNYPTSSAIAGLRVPIISGEEVITCDNTNFISTFSDADRKGIIFSLPFFNTDGKFAGMVSAIMLTSALRGLLPSPDYALVNPSHGYVSIRADAGAHVVAAAAAIGRAVQDNRLLFSAAIPLPLEDPRSTWRVWAGFNDAKFYASPDYRSIETLRLGGYGLAGIVLIAGSLSWFFITRDMRKSRLAAAQLTRARDEARAAEAEASALAAQFKSVNGDIARLNGELSDKIKQLHEAQDEIVRKGRMAQLGQLTATIAHELRNPMGAVRNTAFLIRRKIQNSGLDVDQQLARIDNGIIRCDGIITQLLDFARSKTPDFSAVDLDQWLAEVVEEEAGTLADSIAIECQLGLGGQTVSIDPGRMRRAIANLMHNAAEAMVGRPGSPSNTQCQNPAISIRSRLTSRGAEIAISDNGPGMPGEVLAKVREPLFTTKNFGTGLGLPAAVRIAELHGGGIDISSVPGQGSTFTIWFPLSHGSMEQAA